MYLFFDTETTGLPKDYKAPFTDLDNWPRIVQFAWALYNAEGKLFKKFSGLVKPNGWVIPNIKHFLDQGHPLEVAMEKAEFWITNNLTQEDCEKNGIPIEKVLLQFVNAIDESKFLIAHNFLFDFNVTASEMLRVSLKAQTKPTKICTMMSTINIVKAPYANGRSGYKFPKLMELHRYLFNEDFDGAHDAGFDVAATAKCFFELKRRNLI